MGLGRGHPRCLSTAPDWRAGPLAKPECPPGGPTPDERDTATVAQVRHETPRNHITIESVERIADGDEVEGSLKRHVLGSGSDPADVGGSQTQGLAPGELDRSRFLVHGPDLGHIPHEGERQVPRTTSKVQQPAGAIKMDMGPKIVKQHGRVPRPEAVVVIGRALVQVLAISELAAYPAIVARARHRPGDRGHPIPAAGPSVMGAWIGTADASRMVRIAVDLVAGRVHVALSVSAASPSRCPAR